MGSREDILNTVRNNRPPEFAAPTLEQAWTEYPDRWQQFSDVLQTVGGTCIRLSDLSEVPRHLAEIPEYRDGEVICHAVADLPGGTFDLAQIDDPHDLETVDYAVLPAQFAVAENAALWVDGSHVPQRVIYFIAQHVAIVVKASEIVSHMHAAYERLAFPATPGYGVFISGPSKTADIEQSLVIGAHGSRSLTVFVVESM